MSAARCRSARASRRSRSLARTPRRASYPAAGPPRSSRRTSSRRSRASRRRRRNGASRSSTRWAVTVASGFSAPGRSSLTGGPCSAQVPADARGRAHDAGGRARLALHILHARRARRARQSRRGVRAHGHAHQAQRLYAAGPDADVDHQACRAPGGREQRAV
jgi:hypothetical protein